MAANEYYHGGQPQHDRQNEPPLFTNSPSPAPYSNSRYAPTPDSSAPSYFTGGYNRPPPSQTPSSLSATPGPPLSQTPAPFSQTPGSIGGPPTLPPLAIGNKPTGPSPFDTVFDDNAYPMNSRQNLATDSPSGYAMGSRQTLAADMSPQGYPDTAYYSHGRTSPGPGAGAAEDIPLQDRPGKDPHIDMDDHIYDDPNGARKSRRRRHRKHRVAEGALGMLGADKKRIPWVVYVFTVAQIGVFIGEIIQNSILTGIPIMVKPQFNPMIGPSTQVLINMGARYTPCMHNIDEIQGQELLLNEGVFSDPVLFLCPNATSTDEVCPLSTLCGFGGVPNPEFNGDADQSPEPNQWFRFILPIFMHAGLIHIGFNMLLQLTLAREMEQAIGSLRFALVYISAGIFGFVMGGNFSPPAIASTGASGSLFGIIALTLLDLLYSWKDRKKPVKELLFIILDMVIAFVLGLLPGLDNFSHIGGFLMGLALGICVLHSPNSLRRRIEGDVPYASVDLGRGVEGPPPFFKNPVGFFKGRKKLWWAWWLVRAAALILVIVVFIVLLNNFYTVGNTCDWCQYLSCIPVNDWCELGTIA